MVNNKSRNSFWIVISVIAAAIFCMIYFLSVTQAKEDKKSQLLESKLNEQISTTKGFKASVQQITNENNELKSDLKEKEEEVVNLYKKNDNLSAFAEILTLYINRSNNERIKTLIPTVDRNTLTTEQQELFDKISSELVPAQ